MLRITIAAVAGFAAAAGAALAQGAADVGQYHERFVLDSDPTRELEPSLLDRLRALDAGLADEEVVVISEAPVVVRRNPAAIQGRSVAADPLPPAQGGLSSGAPLGTDPVSDEKRVVGER